MFIEELDRRVFLSAGGLDPYFGTNAVASAGQSSSVGSTRLAVAPDGSIFAAASVTVFAGGIGEVTREVHVKKFLPSGVPDSRFIGTGDNQILISAHNGLERVSNLIQTEALAPLADGTLLVSAGNTLYKFRFNGTRDLSFGRRGALDTGDLVITAIGVQNDGSILLTGGSGEAQTIYTIARLHPDGSPDLSFGAAGRTDIDPGDVLFPDAIKGPQEALGQKILIAPDGSAFVLGTYAVTQELEDDQGPVGEPTKGFLIQHLNSDGSFDTNFNGDGMLGVGLRHDTPAADLPAILQLQSQEILNDASIDAGGAVQMVTSQFGGFSSHVWHFTGTGALVIDPPPTAFQNRIIGDAPLIFQSNGQQIVPRIYSAADHTFTLIRNNPDGSQDKTFSAPQFDDYTLADPALALAKDGSPLVLSVAKVAGGNNVELQLHRLWRGSQPAAEGTAPTITAATIQPEAITVTYRDDGKLSISSLGNRDLRITGPNDFVAYAKFSRLIENQNAGGLIRARYALIAPGGTWDAADNGVYTVRLRAGEVLDTDGNSADARAIATITVNIPAANAPSARSDNAANPFSRQSVARDDPLLDDLL